MEPIEIVTAVVVVGVGIWAYQRFVKPRINTPGSVGDDTAEDTDER